MSINTRAINTTAINDARIYTAQTPASIVDTQHTPYRLESRQSNGTLLNYLPDWWGGSWSESVNVPSTLSFSYDGTDSRSDDFVFPNEIWLYQGDNNTPREKFIVTKLDEVEDEGYIKRVSCQSLMYALSSSVIAFREQANTSIEATVGTWLASDQTVTPKVGLGGFDAAIGAELRSTRIQNKSILSSIIDLHKTIGGFFSVDIHRRLNFRRSIGFNIGHRINIRNNATVINKATDYTGLATRIIAYGRGVNNDIRLTVTVNDTDAQAIYGIIPATFNDQSISSIGDLTDAANAELQRRKTPMVKYDVGVIDLSQTDSLDYSFDASALTLGTQINLLGNPSGSDIDIKTRVLAITRNLDNPLDCKIEVGNPLAGTPAWGNVGDPPPPQETASDIIVELIKQTARLENDTGVIADLFAQIAGGTIETPASPAIADATDVMWWDNSEDVGNFDEKIIDIVEDNDDPASKAAVEDAIATAINDVLEAQGAPPHDASIYNRTAGNVGIEWGDELAAHPTLPTDRPTVYYNTVDDQLWIGYNGSGSADVWTPMQKTTTISGGTPT